MTVEGKPEPTPEHPVYTMVLEDGGDATDRYMIRCDEGWREMIVCEGMYQWAAEWLLRVLGNRPYADGNAP
jgi:NADH:ubiquinone oxidoreductase subunit D